MYCGVVLFIGLKLYIGGPKNEVAALLRELPLLHIIL